MNRFGILVACVAALGGLLYGYDTGIIAGAMIYIQSSFTLTVFAQEFVLSIVLIGAMIGAAFSGTASDHFGRRSTLIWAGIVFAIGSVLSAIAPDAQLLAAARFLVGLAIGITSVTAPLYIAECASSKIRGALVSLYQWAITIGILMADLVAFGLSSKGDWRLMLALACLPSVLMLVGMVVMPESPRWLIMHGKGDKAKSVLARSEENVELAYDEIASSATTERGKWYEIFQPQYRRVLFVGIGLAVLQQISGINTVIYYGPRIFELAGFTVGSPALFATIVVAVVNVLATIIAIAFIDRLGRKPLLYVGAGGMAVALFALAGSFALPALAAFKGIIAVASIVAYIACFAFSLGPITWIIISEIYPQRVRGTAMSIATLSNWAANFAISFSFLSMLHAFGAPMTFSIYGIISLVMIAFTYYFIPETTGQELEAIRVTARK